MTSILTKILWIVFREKTLAHGCNDDWEASALDKVIRKLRNTMSGNTAVNQNHRTRSRLDMAHNLLHGIVKLLIRDLRTLHLNGRA